MAKFIYRMQSILDIKVKLETQARMQFATAKHALNLEEEKLEQLYKRKEEYMEEARRSRSNVLSVKELRESKVAIQTMDDFIVTQTEQVERAARVVEAARERLEEVMKERKTHEKLREKSFEEFKVELNHEESKEIDELTSYTYGQRQKEHR
ncbi:MAG: flagellar export protein FliJ [Lachnospiraceae bacterium]|nr:flagellar export protein FliJ [Lachnospiraceae bacterium]